MPILGVSDAFHQMNEISLTHLLKKTLFCFGYLPALNKEYHLRPHWIIMWLGYFIYMFFRIKSKNKIQFWELIIQLFIIFYYGLSIIFVQIDSYGFRAFLPANFIILAFSIIGIEKLMMNKP